MKRKALVPMMLFLLAWRVEAQYPAPVANGQMLDSGQLQQLLGPIALYPDPLIAEILPAATQPSEIAVAYNYVTQGGDPNAIDQQPWDDSVKALAHYPDVLKMLDTTMAWTAELGQAFLNQPADVENAIQGLRAQAQGLGNLESTPEDTVTSDDGDIEILPTDPDLIYAPLYDPGLVFYQRGYGRNFFTWGVGFHIGPWFDHDLDWHNHNVIVWGHDHPRPSGWWHEAPAQRREFARNAPVWHGAPNRPARPGIVGRAGDRGYESHPLTQDRHSDPVRVNPTPRLQARPEPAVQVHTIQARPTVSAFTQGGSARETQAASSRGAESRQTSRPAPAMRSAPAPSRGGGGNNRR